MTSLLLISLASLAQTTPQKAGSPVRIITDTNFLKKAMHIQIWPDTTNRMQFIIWHDTVYQLILHAEMKIQENSGRSFCFMGTPNDITGMTPKIQPVGIGSSTAFWRKSPNNLHI